MSVFVTQNKEMEDTMQARELISVEELAKRLSVPVSWIYRRTRLGQEAIPHFKMGKYVRFDWEAVLEFYKEDFAIIAQKTHLAAYPSYRVYFSIL